MDVRDTTNKEPKSSISKSGVKSQPSKKCTHLYLQDKYLGKIPKIHGSNSLVVLYLFNNEITKIENLNAVPNLTHLYLQKNKIEQIENLKYLRNLRKLYLGHNNISVLEGLECLEKLEELHIEKQYLPEGNSLCFDPRTIQSLSETLKVLNISHNHLITISFLKNLRCLRVINAAHNDIDDIKDVCDIISSLFYLRDATFTGNPFTKKHRYRESMIANAYNLETLDSKNISEATRSFIKRFEEEKLVHGSKQSINLADIIPGLPKNYPLSLQKAVSASILKESKSKFIEDLDTFDEKNAVFIAWKALPSSVKVTKIQSMAQKKRNEKQIVKNNLPQISTINEIDETL